MISRSFWQGRKVFLTGHTGFKGSWLSLWLQDMGAEVSGLALKPDGERNLFNIAKVGSGMTSHFGDIRDYELMHRLISKEKPSVVFHLAAQSLVKESYANPLETYSVNVLGTATVLEVVRHISGVQAVVCITSDKCYSNREWVWSYRETDSLGGHDPYSSSKASAEIVVDAYRSSFFNTPSNEIQSARVATARAGNVIGGGDFASNRIVPDALNAFEKGETLLVRHPKSVRPWQHVLEPLSGYLQLAQSIVEADDLRFAQAWNFGPDNESETSVALIADYLAAEWGSNAQWAADTSVHPHEARNLRLDSSLAHRELGWFARWNLSQAIEATIAWQRAFLAGQDMRALTLQQINDYSSLTD